MAILTFDQSGPFQPRIEDLQNDPPPDVVECGENNDVWVNAKRSTRNMELVSKIDGKVTKRAAIDDPAFERIAASYGVGPRQIGAVIAAFKA